ncbi:MAG: hypothetical protein CM15mV25_1650 [uncultured marine virus]|nr:MAG: hypothetical protein CM15mV25_1650 [uncultured marine virus]
MTCQKVQVYLSQMMTWTNNRITTVIALSGCKIENNKEGDLNYV